MLQISLALQLYTVRDHLAKDYVRTLRKVKEIGYDFVELAGAPPFETPQTKAHLEDIGLSPAGIHIGLNELESRLDHWIEYCKTLGMENLVCPYLPADRRETREDWLAVAGVQYYAVEQDVCPGDSLDSARMSCEFTTKLIGA